MLRSTKFATNYLLKYPWVLFFAKRTYVNAATVKGVRTVTVEEIKELDDLGKEVEYHYDRNHIPLALSKVVRIFIEKVIYMISQRPYGEPYTDLKAVESIHPFRHIKPKYFTDKLAWGIMNILRVFVHIIFRDRYLNHGKFNYFKNF